MNNTGRAEDYWIIRCHKEREDMGVCRIGLGEGSNPQSGLDEGRYNQFVPR